MGSSPSFCLVSELGWQMQLDLSKNRLASQRARCAGRGAQWGESHLSVWTMGILVNEFSSWLIRQPYFSRISNHSSSGARQAWELFVAGSTNCSATLLFSGRSSNTLKADLAQLLLEISSFHLLFIRARRPGNPLWKVG